MARARRLTGVVVSGLGEGASFMSLKWVREALSERLGFAPYPATLNLRLESGREAEEWERLRAEVEGVEVPPPSPAFCSARCFPVAVELLRAGAGDAVRGAVIFPAVGGYPPDKVEVVAPVNFKAALGVRDGDRVRLIFAEGGQRRRSNPGRG